MFALLQLVNRVEGVVVVVVMLLHELDRFLFQFVAAAALWDHPSVQCFFLGPLSRFQFARYYCGLEWGYYVTCSSSFGTLTQTHRRHWCIFVWVVKIFLPWNG